MTYVVPAKAAIRNINEIHSELSVYFRDNDEILINLDGCAECDLSLVQLIESVRRKASAAGKPVSLVHPAGDAVHSVLARAGLLESFAQDDLKFWLHKEVQ
jgi:MFS superfamily sulfate permease-like transporter